MSQRLKILQIFLLAFLIIFANSAHGKKKRPVPDYDGRPKQPVSVGETILFIPKLVFSPVFFVTDFLIRRPLGFLVTKSEKHHLPQKVQDFFTFGPDNQMTLYPTFAIDFGLRPQGGLNYFWRGFLHKNNNLSVRAAYGGNRWTSMSLEDSLFFPARKGKLGFGGSWNRQPDKIFHGIGPSSLKANRGRFFEDKKEGHVYYEKKMLKDGFLRLDLSTRDVSFGNGDATGIQTFINNGTYPSPPGFTTGYTLLNPRVTIAMGDALPRPNSDVGGRAEFFFDYSVDFKSPSSQQWIKYGGTLVGFVNLFERNRIVTLAFDMELSKVLSNTGVIPFTELPTLGGSGPMPGFLGGRLVDQSATALTLSYHWPIWAYLDGTIHYAVGNVFGTNFNNFRMGLLRQSTGFGIQSTDKTGNAFSLLVAWGSKTFDAGGSFNELRFLIGISRVY